MTSAARQLVLAALLIAASGMLSTDARAQAPAPAHAPACPLMSEEELQEMADAVVVAVAEPGPSDDNGYLLSPARFQIIEELKGDVGGEIFVETPVPPGGGPLPQEDAFLPKSGQTWRLYLYRGSDPTTYGTGLCAGSRRQGPQRPLPTSTGSSTSATVSDRPSASPSNPEAPVQTSEPLSATSPDTGGRGTARTVILGAGGLALGALLVGAYLRRRLAMSPERESGSADRSRGAPLTVTAVPHRR